MPTELLLMDAGDAGGLLVSAVLLALTLVTGR